MSFWHLEFRQNTPLRVVSFTLFSVFGYPDESLSLVFDVLHKKYRRYMYIHFLYLAREKQTNMEKHTSGWPPRLKELCRNF